jgi:hypothetical protein
MFKEFEDQEKRTIANSSESSISLIKDSINSTDVNFFTAIRTQGLIDTFSIDSPVAFPSGSTKTKKYKWDFKSNKLLGQTYEDRVTTGIYLSDADLEYDPAITDNISLISHQDLFNYQKGFLYRVNDITKLSLTSMFSSTNSDTSIDVSRFISIRRSLFKDSVKKNSIKMFATNGSDSLSGFLDGASAGTLDLTNASAFTSALDIANPFAGDGFVKNSFFFVRGAQDQDAIDNVQDAINHPAAEYNIDSASGSITIEAIIRPIKDTGCLFFRRISKVGDDSNTKNNFMKLELTRSPSNTDAAIRFYIRNPDNSGEFSESFAARNVQTSGLFVPSDVGINIFDGSFHHVVVSWSISGYDQNTSTRSGAGAVMGYVDGYKLLNREQVNPRLQGSDSAAGPTIQANMLNQRIPLKTTPFNWPFTGSNIYIGASNFNRDNGDYTGDRFSPALEDDYRVEGKYDGQISHMRVWNLRFNDGTTGYFDNTNLAVSDNSDVYKSYFNFRDDSLTGGVSGQNLVAWWNFNELSSATATDVANQDEYAPFSNTGTAYGNSSIKLFDHKDITTRNVSNIIDPSLSSVNSIPRTFLMYDQIPINKPINNSYDQGAISIKNINDNVRRLGTIFYDMGIITLDGQDEQSGFDFIDPNSGTTGNFGFSSTGLGGAFNVERFYFTSVNKNSRLILDSTALGEEYNFTFNPTGSDDETSEPITDTPITFITSVGLFNDENELLAVAKLSEPVKKDQSSSIKAQINMDF